MLHAEHDIGVHLDEAAIGVISEARIARELRQRFDRHRVQAQIEDRVHHAGHGDARARAHGDEQRRVAIAQLAVGQFAHTGKCCFDGRLQIGGIGLVVGIILGAKLGCDREARWHRQAQIAHLRQIRALAAQQVLHVRAAFRGAVAEGVDPLCHQNFPSDPTCRTPKVAFRAGRREMSKGRRHLSSSPTSGGGAEHSEAEGA